MQKAMRLHTKNMTTLEQGEGQPKKNVIVKLIFGTGKTEEWSPQDAVFNLHLHMEDAEELQVGKHYVLIITEQETQTGDPIK